MEYIRYKGKKYNVESGKLELIDLGITDISDLKGLNELVNLQALYLCNNQIIEIKGLENLYKLKTLRLDGNNITKISGLQNLTNLEFLSLYSNSILEIKGLKILVQLRELDLSENKIVEIQGLGKLLKLKTLSLNSNKIKKIENLEQLENIKSLLLDKNQIYKIEKLDNLRRLISLSLSNNQISEIENLDRLINLYQLDLSGNKIKEIKGIDTLERLSELDLTDNDIEEIKGLENLKKLEIIYLGGNNLKPPDDIFIQDYTSGSQIVYYCRRKRRGEIELSGLYSDDKTAPEKIILYKQELKSLDKSQFVNIGTHKEKKNISWKQNSIFYKKKPLSKSLSERDYNVKNIIIHLIQMHSLKGITPFLKKDDLDYNNKYFDFFIKHFWDNSEIKNNILVYNDYYNRVSSKIDEFLDISVKYNIEKKPHLLIFPENSIPCKKVKDLIKLSNENNLIIIGGLEHKKTKNNHCINIAVIIDNGKIGYQIKQTPIAKKNLDTKEIEYENIKCQSFPRIKIFETSIGIVAIFICKDFLRLCDIISDWAWKNDIDFIVIPSLTSKVLPFHYKLLNIFNYTDYDELKVLFNNIGEYGGSEFFSIDNVKIIEERFRTNIRDNVGEIIIRREYEFKHS